MTQITPVQRTHAPARHSQKRAQIQFSMSRESSDSSLPTIFSDRRLTRERRQISLTISNERRQEHDRRKFSGLNYETEGRIINTLA